MSLLTPLNDVECSQLLDDVLKYRKHVALTYTWQADDRVAKCLADIRQAHDDSIESKQVGELSGHSTVPCGKMWKCVWGNLLYMYFFGNIVI